MDGEGGCLLEILADFSFAAVVFAFGSRCWPVTVTAEAGACGWVRTKGDSIQRRLAARTVYDLLGWVISTSSSKTHPSDHRKEKNDHTWQLGGNGCEGKTVNLQAVSTPQCAMNYNRQKLAYQNILMVDFEERKRSGDSPALTKGTPCKVPSKATDECDAPRQARQKEIHNGLHAQKRGRYILQQKAENLEVAAASSSENEPHLRKWIGWSHWGTFVATKVPNTL
ncbi:hypothetical protein B0H16DRAFT_1704450 [Mycena metata]|uniref:Uncharacterized protein n=1 Tax=Mycena metata TaxID=1033252 RepID=A0AAD7GUU1_9AGAR|nr:hypothetical protein B0H16DRAFT_1704450 [Mycena metata]